MDRQNTLKNKMDNITIRNKMSDKNIMQFKDFKGQSSFNAKIDPFNKESKAEIETMLSSSKHSTKQYIFEWTTYKSKVKPFYDVDMFYESKEEQEKNIEIIKNETKDLLKQIYPETTIAIASSHGEKYKNKSVNKVKTQIKGYAISFHFVMCDYETTVGELREFNELNGLYDVKFKDTNFKMFDKAVYRDGGNMRFLYSYKPNDDRQKIPDNYKDDYCLTKHVIQSSDATNYFKRPMPDTVSPPTTPPVSPKPKDEVVKQEVTVELVKRVYDAGELQEIINLCKVQDDCYEYMEWLQIGMALHNITEGDCLGLGLFKDFTSEYEGFKNKTTKREVHQKWKSFGKEKDGNKLGLTFLRKLKRKYQPKNTQSLEQIFISGLVNVKYGKGIKTATKIMLQEINQRLIFTKETGDYIVLDKKIVRKDNDDLITKPCWYLKAPAKAKDHFVKEKFSFSYEDGEPDDEGEEEGTKKVIHIDPFKLWCEWIDRREVRAIGFDPREKANSDLFNLWNGFNISKEVADGYDDTDCEPILDVIKDIWCQGDEDSYNYVLDYFSHIIQKPHIKTGVLLALRSKQGGGKGIILDKLAQIIGDDHYCQNSNAKFLFGDFNGQLEGKILVNLDEAFWGGDKQMEGVIKNKITEKRQTINKKNKENYVLDDYANYVISTNNMWFCGVTSDDRRHYCLELDNKMAGRSTKENTEYFKRVLDAPCEAFAKLLYNRDISNYKPRQFKKTKLLQEQVERNWTSPSVWWNEVMKDGGFDIRGKFVEWNKVLIVQGEYGNTKHGIEIKNKKKEKKVVYEKDFLFNCYDSKSYDGRKFMNSAFWRELQKSCMGNLYVENKLQIKKERKIYVFLPSLEEARKKWNEMQEYDYDYDVDDENEWEVDEDCSDDECELSDDE